jgi:hypothetical protein
MIEATGHRALEPDEFRVPHQSIMECDPSPPHDLEEAP